MVILLLFCRMFALICKKGTILGHHLQSYTVQMFGVETFFLCFCPLCYKYMYILVEYYYSLKIPFSVLTYFL